MLGIPKYSEILSKLLISAYLVWILLITLIFAQQNTLLWEDEFNGNSVDKSKWSFETGDGCQYGKDLCGWGNKEEEYYQENNAEVKDGKLYVYVKSENVKDKAFTSAKMTTKLSGNWKFSRVEVRAKIPNGKGTWPAIWMMATKSEYGDYPRRGVIDIAEFNGKDPKTAVMTAHYGNNVKKQASPQQKYRLPVGSFADEFHVFAVEKTTDKVEWFIDNVSHQTVVASTATSQGYTYPFNEDFFLILNVAVGGDFLKESPDAGELPLALEVDYVKVYQL